ncbi:Retaining alpha-galactosidase precursor [Planctomycetes bacterium CA13]|uniref:Retaining alpha-galactosidase n=1 Tax=Novipirellula herctigrandis TaxID=2527986 RepID=A0A5C5ZC95_9BACT|nr:Retaining alpha-galactosidase precursor [Planctomycetes bacterium CA13]
MKSPDGQLVAQIDVNKNGSATNLLNYSVTWKGRPVLAASQLGLEIDGMVKADGLRIVDVQTRTVDQTWKTVCGERSEVRDHYNEATLHLQTVGNSLYKLSITFRAFDEGFAFRYTVPEQANLKKFNIRRERSEFRFTDDHKTWPVYNAQGDYQEARLSEVKSGCERPLTIQADDDLFVAIGEAGLVDYARMKFGPIENTSTGLVSELHSPVEAMLPLDTPWRFILLADRAGGLLERNYMVLNLNEPCAIKDTSWIKPGKVIREVTLTTDGGKALVDFAVRRGLQYIHFDAGWYGHEYDDASDATTITVDPKRSKGPLALQEVIAYAKERGIGVIVYVNRRALEKQLDEILPLYESWGIAGVKYGFVNVGSQNWTTWLHDAIRKAADHHLMVDVHDEYRPTGYERTYPNLMTAEGIAGDETSPENSNTLTILFSRLLCGPADNTVCYFDARVDRNATHAYQLAKALCIYSPWQYLYWYDRPASAPSKTGGAGGGNQVIDEAPELEFFDVLPTSWDETRVIHGEIGKYAVIARRHGDNWYVGAMNSGKDRTLSLPLDFLKPATTYTAHRYIDDPTVDTRTKVRVTTTDVTNSSVIQLSLPAQGGEAIRIVPST